MIKYLESRVYYPMTKKDWGNLIRIVVPLTMEQMAEILGCSKSAISLFESGKMSSDKIENFYNETIHKYNIWRVAEQVKRSRALLKANDFLAGGKKDERNN